MDAITLLKDDHHTVEQLFKRYEQTGDRAFKQRRDLVDRMIEELSVHAAIEEQLFYPVTREVVPTTEDLALEGLEEHHIVKWLLEELRGMDPEHERFHAKVTVLMENVRHHVEEEESDYFPKVREELGRNALNDLGDAMAKVKEVAPTRPHPRAPDTPPANFVVGTAAGVIDRVGDTLSGVAQGGRSAAVDLVARIRGEEPPRRARPEGSPTAKAVAAQVRARAAEVAGAGEEATKAAASGAKATGRAARSGAKGTATSARKGASATKRTAKSGATRTRNAARSGAARTASAAKR